MFFNFLYYKDLVDTVSSFKSKLKSFYYIRLLNVFDGDNFGSFKLICLQCRRVHIFSVCTCYFNKYILDCICLTDLDYLICIKSGQGRVFF